MVTNSYRDWRGTSGPQTALSVTLRPVFWVRVVGPDSISSPSRRRSTADACQRAHSLPGDPFWSDSVALAAQWFACRADVGVAMLDRITGCAYDGLKRDGVDGKQGAEVCAGPDRPAARL